MTVPAATATPETPLPSLADGLPLPDGRRLVGRQGEATLELYLDGHPLLRLRRQGAGDDEYLEPLALPTDADAALETLAYWCFASDPARLRIRLRLAQPPAAARRRGLLLGEGDDLRIERDLFWQLPGAFLRAPSGAGFPRHLVMDAQGRRHPVRPPKPEGEVYRRFDARLGAWVSLRCLDLNLDADLARFNRWQNSPRVAQFWQEEGDLAQHRRYLQTLHDDPRALTLLGCVDDEPFAYFEAYWAKEDRIAPFYPVDDYDRGIHMLVGEEHHRGPHKVAAWMGALCHYLFLDEPRTQRVVAEPRADNAKMIGHMQRQGFYREKEFDFPHKRAALMVLPRDTFFDRCALA